MGVAVLVVGVVPKRVDTSCTNTLPSSVYVSAIASPSLLLVVLLVNMRFTLALSVSMERLQWASRFSCSTGVSAGNELRTCARVVVLAGVVGEVSAVAVLTMLVPAVV